MTPAACGRLEFDEHPRLNNEKHRRTDLTKSEGLCQRPERSLALSAIATENLALADFDQRTLLAARRPEPR
jgi:hypothetical protein